MKGYFKRRIKTLESVVEDKELAKTMVEAEIRVYNDLIKELEKLYEGTGKFNPARAREALGI